MGGLAHTFEAEGLATTQISLIREHTEKIRPPRALWVPFELGRPLGAPGDSEFQKQVLMAALRLLESPRGPLLVDFERDAPAADAPSAVVACPIGFKPAGASAGGIERLLADFSTEVAQMRNWYDLAVARRARTTSAVSSLTPEAAADFLMNFVRRQRPESFSVEVSPAEALRMAVEDLKAYYLEGVTAQPGQPTGSAALADWFWGCTHAARVIDAVRRICLKMQHKEFQLLGNLLLVPRTQLHRFED